MIFHEHYKEIITLIISNFLANKEIKTYYYYEWSSNNQTISSELYCQQLDRLSEALKVKRLALVRRKNIIFITIVAMQ